jgi:Asp-tRNA(Asn)/Glu-tRNA(Gln) amidotransferase A subunit family amidase
VLKAIYGPDGQDPTVVNTPFRWDPMLPVSKLRVGYVKAEFEAIQDEEPKKIFGTALDVLKNAGAKLEPIELPDYPYQGIVSILSCEAAAAFDELTRSEKLDQLVGQGRGDWPNTFRTYRLVPAVDYIKAQRVRTMLIRDAAKVMQKIDVFVSPGSSFIPRPLRSPPPEPPPAAERKPAGPPRGGGNRTLVMTNLTGHPSVVVPCGFRQGLPIGLIFTSNLFDEGAALRLALAYESATEWHKKRPPI